MGGVGGGPCVLMVRRGGRGAGNVRRRSVARRSEPWARVVKREVLKRWGPGCVVGANNQAPGVPNGEECCVCWSRQRWWVVMLYQPVMVVRVRHCHHAAVVCVQPATQTQREKIACPVNQKKKSQTQHAVSLSSDDEKTMEK